VAGSLDFARDAGHALINTGLQAGDSGLEIDISRFNGLPSRPMSVHSYSRCWIHLIWGTLNREKLLNKEAAARLSRHLAEYADTKGVYMKINYINADHVHALIDLPNNMSIEELIQLLKGQFLPLGERQPHFAGEILPGAEATAPFPCLSLMSYRLVPTLPGKRTPPVRTFADELRESSSAMVCAGRMRKAVETALLQLDAWGTGLKAGVNEKEKARTDGYFFIKSSTAAVIATIPVRIVGSGTGANLLECKLGRGDAPGFFESAILDGSTAPT